MNTKLDLAEGALADRLANSVMTDRLCFVLAFVSAFISRLGVMLVFWFFTRLFILCYFIIVIYIIRIVSSSFSLCTLLSLGLVQLIRPLLCWDRTKRTHQVVRL